VDLNLPELQDYPLTEKAQLLRFLNKEKQAQFRRPTPLELTKEIRDLILVYPFPGNIRELENILERLYALCPDRTPTKADLPNWILSPDPSFSLKLEDVIQEHVQRVFEKQGGNQKKTAEVLGISYNTLRKRLGIG
jgi:two-component system response regulator HydG